MSDQRQRNPSDTDARRGPDVEHVERVRGIVDEDADQVETGEDDFDEDQDEEDYDEEGTI